MVDWGDTPEGVEISVDRAEVHVAKLGEELRVVLSEVDELTKTSEDVASLVSTAVERSAVMSSLTKENTESHRELLQLVESLKSVEVSITSTMEDRLEAVKKIRELEQQGLLTKSLTPHLEASEDAEGGSFAFLDGLSQAALNLPAEDVANAIRQKYGGQIAANLPKIPGLGGLSSTLSKGGAGLGLPAAGIAAALVAGKVTYDQFQSAQAYTNITGGTSVGESIQYDMQARLASLNPFVDHGQAKRAIDTVLREGYNQDLYGDASSFLMGGVRSGLDPSRAMDLFNTAVVKGTATVESLEVQLESLRETASETDLGLEQLMTRYQSGLETFQGLGAGDLSGGIAKDLTMAFDDVEIQGYDPTHLLSSTLFQTYLAQSYGGSAPVDVTAFMSMGLIDAEGILRTQENWLRSLGFWPGITREEILQNAQLQSTIRVTEGLNTLGSPDETARIIEAMMSVDKSLGNIEASRKRDLEKYGAQISTPETFGEYALAVGGSEWDTDSWGFFTQSQRDQNTVNRSLSSARRSHWEETGQLVKTPLVERFLQDWGRDLGDVDIIRDGKSENFMDVFHGSDDRFQFFMDLATGKSRVRKGEDGDILSLTDIFGLSDQVEKSYTTLDLTDDAKAMVTILNTNPSLNNWVHNLSVNEDADIGSRERSDVRPGG